MYVRCYPLTRSKILVSTVTEINEEVAIAKESQKVLSHDLVYNLKGQRTTGTLLKRGIEIALILFEKKDV